MSTSFRASAPCTWRMSESRLPYVSIQKGGFISCAASMSSGIIFRSLGESTVVSVVSFTVAYCASICA